MVKRLEKNINGDVSSVITQRFDKIKKQFKINLSNIFGKSHNRAIQIGIDLGGKKSAKSNIKQKIMAVNKVMANDISNIKDEQSQNVTRVIAQSYAQGLPSLQLKQQVSKELDTSGYKIDRAIRTNTAYLSSLTKLMTWADMGFTKYSWVLGKNDSVTRPHHKWLHGRVFLIKDALNNKAPIPGHIPNKDGSTDLSESMSCRCGVKLEKDSAKVS